jgi:O-antigen ligase
MIREKKRAIHRKISLGLTLAIAFVIPVSKGLLPVLIVLLALNWLIEGEYIRTVPLLFREKPRLLMLSFSALYLLYLAGLIHTSNFQYAREDLEVKLSIFIFPLIFATSAFPLFSKKETGMILRSFAAGCIAGSLIFLGRAAYEALVLHKAGAFYYTNLAWNFHPSYYAMYIAFAISNIIFFFAVRKSVTGSLKVALHILILLFFTLMIVLLSSKAGLLLWLSVIGFYAVILVFKFKRWVYGPAFLALALAAFAILLLSFPNAATRVSQAKQDMTSSDAFESSARSTGDRVLIWRASKEVIRRNLIVGVGTGDVRDELMVEYRNENVITIFKHYLNAHNQYIQTFIALGISGLLLLVAMMLVPAFFSFRRENYMYFAFLFLVAISMFVESMLERQEGVVFYVFFNTLLFSSAIADPEQHSRFWLNHNDG